LPFENQSIQKFKPGVFLGRFSFSIAQLLGGRRREVSVLIT